MHKEIKWKNEKVLFAKLKGYKENPREITPENKRRLKKSLKKFNQVKPLLVNSDYTVIGGNQRLSVMDDGLVWVRVPSRKLTKAEMLKVSIVHNNKIGDWDFGKLSELEFDDDVLVEMFGFDREMVNEMDFDFDDLDFDDMDDDKVIKKLIVSFPKDVDVKKMVARINKKTGAETFEESLLALTANYENN